MKVPCCVCFLALCSLVAGSDIVVVPATHQFIAVDSNENVTFDCNVSSPNPGPGGNTDREAVWQVQDRQIQNDPNNPTTMLFANIGIHVMEVESGFTTITITRDAREFYLNETPPNPNITVRCASFAFPLGDVGEEINVTTFYVPSIPLELSLNPDPDDLLSLVFSWTIPAGSLAGVPLTYSPAITGLSVNILNVTSDTFIVFRDDASQDCQLHTFSVFASNTAGDGLVNTINETIPISPDISAINNEFSITQVSLADPITITISVPQAISCNPRFPILNYFLSISSFSEELLLDFDEDQGGNPFVQDLSPPELQLDAQYQVSVRVCISITCRQSELRILRTTDVQTARIIFFENNVFVSCTFASNSNARGCQFEFELFEQGGMESFFLPRSGSEISQCVQSENQRSAYESLFVRDVEENDDLGVQLIMQSTVLNSTEDYTSLTGCTIPEPSSGLSAGAIVGIIIAALVIAAAILCVVIVIVVYRVRTGHWFKLREKDDEKLTVHFEKELLMGEEKPKRKPKIGTSSRISHDSPDQATVELADAAIAPKLGSEEQDAAVMATNPDSAFTLDISSDRKKVQLHLNRALIRRVLQDKNLNTMDRKKPRRQVSLNPARQHLLPLHCEVRVQVDEDEQASTI